MNVGVQTHAYAHIDIPKETIWGTSETPEGLYKD